MYPEKLVHLARLVVTGKGDHLDQQVRKGTSVHPEILGRLDPVDLRDFLVEKAKGVTPDLQVKMATLEKPVHQDHLERPGHKALQDHLLPKARKETLVHRDSLDLQVKLESVEPSDLQESLDHRE